ncbi:tyrosine-type recombinase/integrase [Mycolicibacterium sp. S2-37]|uniref:tyrosine-type recombinase/integrase n=1 Tax=Mycolicibacterium sp. S2-37 TaxID=2810297 RepID=UPI001A946A55|nr:tyrosine-type recombinase/integrase [Mycolicibacterium sp. S2-37]MBO0680345.1 tyrosine-type recombinase/integrase [Mycolicibacterium sp. S2-37]
MTKPLLDLAELLPSWTLALRAERKSPATVQSYQTGVTAFLRWCESTGTPPELTKANAQTFVADLLDSGAAPKTAVARLLGVKQFSAWLTAEGELPTDPLFGIKQPKVDRKVVEALTDDQLRALIKACSGKGFTDRRDEAIVRLMAETGARAGEVVGLDVGDVDLHHGMVTIRRGKGGKGRTAPIGPQTATAIDRYLRMRRTHRLADTPKLWLGADNWRDFNYHGLRHALQRRAEAAGIDGFHPHKMRHTAATRWLRAGGSEGGLMALAGWQTREMLDRYTGASASERAAAEARKLGLGDL